MRLLAAVVCLLLAPVPAAQQLVVLKITVTILDADQRARPVPRHALLVSDNPATGAPRRVVTALDGTAEVRLRPGNYTVESDEPLVFQGKAYEWRETVDVAGAMVLALTASNAQVEAAAAGAASADLNAAAGSSSLLLDWQDSVFSIWSPTALGAGFLVDARGLIATNYRLVRRATTIEVQLSPMVKVAGRVLVADPTKNIAIIWVDPQVVASAKPVKLGYSDGGPAVAQNDKLFAITAHLPDDKSLASGTVRRVNTHTILVDVRVEEDSLGAPLFNASGAVVALTTPSDDVNARTDAPAVRIDDARAAIADAEKKMAAGLAPSGARLPLEPQTPFSDESLRESAQRRGGNPAYRVPAEDFDVSIITPPLIAAARRHGVEGGAAPAPAAQPAVRALQDFGNWSEYVRDNHPVVMIRVTPKLVEGFWTTVARGAASTQGIALPPIKHLKATFSSMRVYCGADEVTPIHPFRIEQRVAEGTVVYEGLYVLDPASIGPTCGTVKLALYSAKAPQKPDVRTVDDKILQQIWSDFEPVRARR